MRFSETHCQKASLWCGSYTSNEACLYDSLTIQLPYPFYRSQESKRFLHDFCEFVVGGGMGVGLIFNNYLILLKLSLLCHTGSNIKHNFFPLWVYSHSASKGF